MAGAQVLAQTLTLVPLFLPEAALGSDVETPPLLGVLPDEQSTAALTACLLQHQADLWELTHQSSSAEATEHEARTATIIASLLQEDDAPLGTAGDSSPSVTPVSALSQPAPHVQAGAALSPKLLGVAAAKLHMAIAKSLAAWCDEQRTPDCDVALSGAVTAALRWHGTRRFLLGYRTKPVQPEQGAQPVSTLQSAFQHAWALCLATLSGLTESMGRTPFQAGLLAVKLELGMDSADADDSDRAGAAVRQLAHAALAGDVDPAVEVVLSRRELLVCALALDALSTEVQATLSQLHTVEPPLPTA